MSTDTNPPFREIARKTAICVLLIVAIALGRGFFSGRLGEPGADTDDVMRLVQIRDFLSGQSWFDLHQYRLGLGEGTLMHWSRLVDAPIIILTKLFSLFLDQDTALAWAITIWPPLSVAFVILGMVIAAWGMNIRYAVHAALLMGFATYFTHYRFLPGAIDHHNLQIGLLAVGAGSLIAAERRDGFGWLAGVAFAVSVAVGSEVLIFVATACAFVAIDWAWNGELRKALTFRFGLAFGLTLLTAFLITTAPSNYLVKACDTMSVVECLIGLIGGLGLTILAIGASGLPRLWRVQCLLGFGLAILIFIRFFAPDCLHDPLDSLSPIARRFWLANVAEARPLITGEPDDLSLLISTGSVLLVSPFVVAWFVWRGYARRTFLLLGALIASSIFLIFMQVRFLHFGQLFSVMMGIYWVAFMLRKRQEAHSGNHSGNLGYLYAVALTLPALWSVASKALEPEVQSQNTGVIAERSKATESLADVLEALKDEPTGRVYASLNWSDDILLKTKHSVVAGNYHRAASSIDAFYRIAWMDEEAAESALRMYEIDYVFISATEPVASERKEDDPEGFVERLQRGDVPDFLEPISGGLEAGGAAFRMSPSSRERPLP